MPATDRRGFVSWKILLLLVVLGVAGYSASHLRDWSMSKVEANAARSKEFDRRVQAQRLAPLKHDLEKVGIHVDDAPTPLVVTGATETVDAEVARPSLMERARRFWAKLVGKTQPAPPPPIPQLRDSMGLLPGERMFLPGGRMIEYDTNAVMKVWPSEEKR